jgi:hypothetical protein
MELSRSALTPHSIDLSARALWALGRDDTLAVVAVGLPPPVIPTSRTKRKRFPPVIPTERA